jgi:hypothetical protein
LIPGLSDWIKNGTYGMNEEENLYQVFKLGYLSYRMQAVVFVYLSTMTSSIIFIDLYLTLINPFHPREKRVIFYQVFIFIIGLLVFIDNCSYFIAENIKSPRLFDSESISNVLFEYLFVWTIIPSILILLRLCRRGTSKELRILVIKRHIFYSFIFLLCLFNVIDDQKNLVKTELQKVMPDEKD